MLAALPAAAQFLYPHDPSPFRRDSLDGRDFTFDNLTFLHRLSYSPMPLLGRRRPTPPNSFEATTGSTKQDEFYVFMKANVLFPLDGPLFIQYRFRRDEDFDGRHDQNLLGIGLAFESGWRFSLHGDVVGNKEAIDAHVDVSWTHPASGEFIRFIWVAPDAFFNEKSLDANYQVTPYTYFMNGRIGKPGETVWRGFAQVDTTAELVEDAGLRSRNRSRFGGVSVEKPLTDNATVEFAVEASRGKRSRESRFRPFTREKDLQRDYHAQAVEWRRDLNGGHQLWMGVHHLNFEEEDRRPHDAENDADREREETTFYLGRSLSFSERIHFLPTVLLAWQDIETVKPSRPELDYSTRRFSGKFVPSFEFTLNEETGARISLALTTRLHRVGFGGGNVQFVLPF